MLYTVRSGEKLKVNKVLCPKYKLLKRTEQNYKFWLFPQSLKKN